MWNGMQPGYRACWRLDMCHKSCDQTAFHSAFSSSIASEAEKGWRNLQQQCTTCIKLVMQYDYMSNCLWWLFNTSGPFPVFACCNNCISCRYPSSITENGLFSTIQCLPDVGGLIDSHNASILLARRGMAYVRREDQLIGIDNKLRPYHYQTHAGEWAGHSLPWTPGGWTCIKHHVTRLYSSHLSLAFKFSSSNSEAEKGWRNLQL